MNKIELTTQDIVTLLLEMTIYRDDLNISSNSSFLTIFAALEYEIDRRSRKCIKVKQQVI